ncbi:MAG: 5-methylcytosine-specific restriction endonuclease system specificity protein McrC [Oscillospiraceae bacterium]|nr:5-methylcytosine-specific restriction endonuclease system specificity protein McrC [Oscillospiraceae bacterium]
MANSILIKNIYYMLAYAFQSLNPEDDELINNENFDNALDLFASILSKGISVQLKRGLYREYIYKQDDISIMHGKINIQGTIKNKFQHKQLLSCEYDELSENNILNRIIKTTSSLLIKSEDVKSEYRNLLKQQMMFFSEVDEIDLFSVRWPLIKFHRNNQSYRILIGICELIVEGMIMNSDENGDYKLSKFNDDQRMCRLYEKFLLEYYKKHYPNLFVRAGQLPWILDDCDDDMLPVMQTDVMIYDKKEKSLLILDAKYYSHTTQSNYDKRTIHSGNLYQIFTYVKNSDRRFGGKWDNVSGILLYAKTEEEIQPDKDYVMSGNRISVKTLDLNQEFPKIKEQLNAIIDIYFVKD